MMMRGSTTITTETLTFGVGVVVNVVVDPDSFNKFYKNTALIWHCY